MGDTMVLDTAGWQLRCFILALVSFHSSEFMLAAFYGRCVGVGSLLLTAPYLVAVTAGLAEYVLGSWLVPQFKSSTSVASLGLLLIVVGEVTRKLAIVTAQSNFTHDIKISHEEGHKLVTHGIYRFVRHPSYLGFFIFAIGTQVILCNPIMTIAYAIILWRFFTDRIEYEESFLHEFFGQDYEEYSNRTPSGIPFFRFTDGNDLAGRNMFNVAGIPLVVGAVELLTLLNLHLLQEHNYLWRDLKI